MKLIILAALAVVSMSATPAKAQERDFCADRPGKGTPTCILDVGRWQVELGLFDYARQDDVGSRAESWAVGDAFVRFGLTPLTEVQVGLTPYVRERTRVSGLSETVDGIGDLSVGFRHSLRNPDGSGLSVAVAGFMTAPTGSPAVRADGFEGGVVLPIAAPLDDNWGLSLSPEIDVAVDADGNGRHAVYSMVAGVGRGFGEWDLGAEVWVSRDDDPLEPTTQSTFDVTAVWSPPALPDGQLDFGLNFGLNEESPDIEFGVGLARRF